MTERATKAPSTRAATGQRKAAGAAKPRGAGSRPASGSKTKTNAPAKTAAKRKPAARKTTPRKRAPAKTESLIDQGARLVGITGPFGSRALVEMPTTLAEQLFPDGLATAAPLDVIEAVARDVDLIRKRDKQLADSALAAAALALAREISNPYNSATSKSMCAREMREHLDRLRELLPPAKEEDKVDDLARAREVRRARSAGGAGA